MQRQQLELWSAEPHPTPQLHPQLTPSQQDRLIQHLAELMLKLAQASSLLPSPPTPTQGHDHER
jgi:ABC-type uncharacterized transport system involved in gliding motility auxiliary subunit